MRVWLCFYIRCTCWPFDWIEQAFDSMVKANIVIVVCKSFKLLGLVEGLRAPFPPQLGLVCQHSRQCMIGTHKHLRLIGGWRLCSTHLLGHLQSSVGPLKRNTPVTALKPFLSPPWPEESLLRFWSSLPCRPFCCWNCHPALLWQAYLSV